MTDLNSTASAPQTTTAASDAAPAPAPAAEPTPAPAADASAPAPAPESAPATEQEPTADEGGDAGLLKNSEPEGKSTEPKLPDTLGAPKENYDYKDVDTGGVELGGETLDAFNTVAKELNLSQKAASTIVSRVAPAMEKAQQTALRNAKVQWIKDVKNDASIDWAKNSTQINQAYKDFTTPKLREMFAKTGLDSHPEIVRMFQRISEKISPDSFERGAAGARQTISAKQFYDKSHMND